MAVARRLLAVLAAVAALAALAPVAPAGAVPPPEFSYGEQGEPVDRWCAPNGGRRIAGTMRGEDDRYVWSLIGIEYFDAQGNKLDRGGCRAPVYYSQVVRMNRQEVSGDGATSGSGLTYSWELPAVPSNVHHIWIEAYPMTDDPFETVDRSTYGHTMRRKVVLPATNLDLRLPLRCDVRGGTAGGIQGQLVLGGRAVTPQEVYAWSTSPDGGHYIMGWGIGDISGDQFRISPLAKDQHYTVWVIHNGVTHRLNDVWVNGCTTTMVRLGEGAGVLVESIPEFDDVPKTAFYAPHVQWAYHAGVTTGVGGSRMFEPLRDVTRGEVVTFLWRTMQKPAVTGLQPFSDVPSGSFYTDPVVWAYDHGITTGVGGSNRFEPTRPVTRGEVVTFLWRAAGEPLVNGPSFSDVAPTAFYADAVEWAAKLGITTGVGGTDRFEPNRNVTRGEVATFLSRFARR